jgi:hypothetical protein
MVLEHTHLDVSQLTPVRRQNSIEMPGQLTRIKNGLKRGDALFCYALSSQ